MPTLPLVVARNEEIAHTFTIDTFYMIPSEPVALWYDTPDAGSVTVGMFDTDIEGHLQTFFRTDSLSQGKYLFVAHGLWSGLDATSTLVIP
jgi:hypothetical protein